MELWFESYGLKNDNLANYLKKTPKLSNYFDCYLNQILIICKKQKLNVKSLNYSSNFIFYLDLHSKNIFKRKRIFN